VLDPDFLISGLCFAFVAVHRASAVSCHCEAARFAEPVAKNPALRPEDILYQLVDEGSLVHDKPVFECDFSIGQRLTHLPALG